MNTIELTDQQLYSQLRHYRPEIGPVVDTTRELYTKMLLRALDDQNDQSLLSSPSGRNQPPSSNDVTPEVPTPHTTVEAVVDDLGDEEVDHEGSDIEFLTESAVEDDNFSRHSLNRSYQHAHKSRLVIEEELPENHFFAKAFLVGLALVLISVFILYLLRSASD